MAFNGPSLPFTVQAVLEKLSRSYDGAKDEICRGFRGWKSELVGYCSSSPSASRLWKLSLSSTFQSSLISYRPERRAPSYDTGLKLLRARSKLLACGAAAPVGAHRSFAPPPGRPFGQMFDAFGWMLK